MRFQYFIGGLGLALLFVFGIGCGSENVDGPTTTEQAPVVAAAPDLSVVVSRSQARWELVVAGDWLQSYDFMPPSVRKNVKLGMYLSGKEHHEYTNPSVPKLIGSEGNVAYLELSVLWEPHHPILDTVKDRPDDMTEELTMIETWEWFEGEWYLRGSQRPKEFLEEHPDVRNK
jgi:hypothetical protein